MSMAPTPASCWQGAGSLLYPVVILGWAEVSQDCTNVILTVKDSFFRNGSFSRTYTTGHERATETF